MLPGAFYVFGKVSPNVEKGKPLEEPGLEFGKPIGLNLFPGVKKFSKLGLKLLPDMESPETCLIPLIGEI